MAILVTDGSLETIKQKARYPLRLVWPKGAAVVALGRFRYVAGGRLEVEYRDKAELETALRLAAERARD